MFIIHLYSKSLKVNRHTKEMLLLAWNLSIHKGVHCYTDDMVC